MANTKKQVKGDKVAAYSIKNNKICKLNNSRYVPVTNPDEIAKAKLEIARQLGIGKEPVQSTGKVAEPQNKHTSQDEVAAKPSKIEGQSTRMAANNMWVSARINYEIKLLGDKIANKIHGQEINKRDIESYGVPSLLDVLGCTEKINEETEELIKSLHQLIDESI